MQGFRLSSQTYGARLAGSAAAVGKDGSSPISSATPGSPTGTATRTTMRADYYLADATLEVGRLVAQRRL